MTTKDYNKLFLDALERLRDADTVPDETFVRFLADQDAEARLWPSDRQLKEAFLELPLYRLLTRGRLRMVLEGIEGSLRSPKTEEDVPRGKLTIEHVIPQQWHAHWPLPDDGDDEDVEQERNRLVHTVGNLTLVTKSLNPAMSNSAWSTKREALEDHSVLLLNKNLLAEWGGGEFDDAAIRARSITLAEIAASIWRSPQAYLKDIAEAG